MLVAELGIIMVLVLNVLIIGPLMLATFAAKLTDCVKLTKDQLVLAAMVVMIYLTEIVYIHHQTLRNLLIKVAINGKMVFALNALLVGFSMPIKIV